MRRLVERARRRVGERGGERGAVAVMVGILSILLFVVAALVVDLGFARDVKRQSQISADASALAAAGVLYPTTACQTSATPVPPCVADAVAAAKAYASSNFGVAAPAWTACQDPDRPADFESLSTGGTSCISFDDLARPRKVRVRLPVRDVPTGLGRITGIAAVPISTRAVANIEDGEARSCGLCVIGTGHSELNNGGIVVTGGSVHLNGSVETGPNGELTVSPGNLITTVGTATGNINPQRTPALPIEDPLATAPGIPPDYSALTAKAAGTNPCGAGGGPGRYGGYAWSSNEVCNLSPGLYVVTGQWLLGNNTKLNGTGVTLYFTCGTAALVQSCRDVNPAGAPGGSLNVKNGTADLVAPSDPASPLNGYLLLYDRDNTAALNLQGNGETFYTGTIYALRATMEFPGTTAINVTNGPVVIDKLYGNGNKGELRLHAVNSAALPAAPGDVHLFE